MDGVIAVILFVIPVALFWYFGLKWWAWFMTAVGAVFGGAELLAFLITHKTLSQQFWAWSLVNPTQAWIMIAVLGGFWILLLWHLAWKLLKKKDA